MGEAIIARRGGAPKAELYQRPSDWLPLPPVSENEQKIVGLHAVWPHDSNFVALRCEGAYTVDWGDGTVTNHNSGEAAYHKYEYDDIPSETECSRGYRQVIVTVTPQTGHTFTRISFDVKHNQADLADYYATGWLDVAVAGSSIERLTFADWEEDYPTHSGLLEQFELVGTNSIEDFEEMFAGCYSLQNIPQLNTSKGSIFSYMFAYCSSLPTIPPLDTAQGWSFIFMFLDCASLQSIPHLDTSAGIYFGGLFEGCSSLRSIPPLDTSQGESFGYMFYGCSSLQSIPPLDTSSGDYFAGMFSGCSALSTIPLLDTSNGYSFYDMFFGCYSLQNVPQLDLSSGESLDSMFEYCPSLSAAPVVGAVEDISFEGCRLSRQALVDIFTGLGTANATIDITDNWGASDLTPQDRAIATNKGWTIIG